MINEISLFSTKFNFFKNLVSNQFYKIKKKIFLNSIKLFNKLFFWGFCDNQKEFYN